MAFCKQFGLILIEIQTRYSLVEYQEERVYVLEGIPNGFICERAHFVCIVNANKMRSFACELVRKWPSYGW